MLKGIEMVEVKNTFQAFNHAETPILFRKLVTGDCPTDSLAEWSKAPRSGRGLSGGVGSNPTAVIFLKA